MEKKKVYFVDNGKGLKFEAYENEAKLYMNDDKADVKFIREEN